MISKYRRGKPDQDPRLHTQRPSVTLVAAEPIEIFATAQSDAVVGEPLILKVALIDEHANPAATSSASLVLEVIAGRADLPSFDEELDHRWSGSGPTLAKTRPMASVHSRFGRT